MLDVVAVTWQCRTGDDESKFDVKDSLGLELWSRYKFMDVDLLCS